MRIEPTGVFFVGICDIQSEQCSAREPAPITAVKQDGRGSQINVCRNCLEYMIRDGEWEVAGAKLDVNVDFAVLDTHAQPQLIVEVKAVQTVGPPALVDRARRVRRNLLMHSRVPSTPYFMVLYYPTTMFLWTHSNTVDLDAQPDYNVNVQRELANHASSLTGSYSQGEIAEFAASAWIKDLMTAPPKQRAKIGNGWLKESGLGAALKSGYLVEQARLGPAPFRLV